MAMTETDRSRGGRFVKGGIAGPGRPKGARSRLGEAFIEDLRDAWEKRGIKALEQCATKKPAEFVRIVASLMPRDINLSVGLDAGAFVDKFRQGVALLGNEPPALTRQPLRTIKPIVIDHVANK